MEHQERIMALVDLALSDLGDDAGAEEIFVYLVEQGTPLSLADIREEVAER